MVHRRGMKLIVYASTGYFERTDPDFRREWARELDNVALHYRYARCSPASEGWRAYFLPRLFRVFDGYGVDEIYNDLGYPSLASHRSPPTPDEVLAFEETATYDGVLTDLLSLVCDEIHRRGGIVKLHYGGAKRPQSGDVKVYDYLWVGEYMKSADKLRESVKNFLPGPRLPSPVELESLSVPFDDGFGLDDGQGGSPVGPEPGEPDPEDPVAGPRLGAFDGVLVDGNLLPQCEDLGGQPEPGHQERSDQKLNRLDDAHEEVSELVWTWRFYSREACASNLASA